MDSEIDVSNDPEVERQGANAAAEYAAAFWSKLTAAARQDGRSLDPLWESPSATLTSLPSPSSALRPSNSSLLQTQTLTLTHSVKFDKELYARFRSNFPVLYLDSVPSSYLHTPQWRSILVAAEGTVPDFSFMTLFRQHSNDPYWATDDHVCDDLLVIPRAQFLMVEIARCKEGYYGKSFRAMLTLFELKTFAEAITSNLDTPSSLAATINKLHAAYPLPHKSAMSKSGVGRALKRAAATGLPLAVTVLETYRHGVELADFSKNSDSARFALRLMLNKEVGGASVGGVVDDLSCDLDVAALTPAESSAVFAKTGVIYNSTPVFTPEQLDALKQMTSAALDDLVTEQLTPRNLNFDTDFDFNEVRHRPGNRLDNRYHVKPDAVLSNDKVMDVVSSIFGKSEAGKFKLMYAGVVHAFSREDREHRTEKQADPQPQVWHRDGPSLFDNDKYHSHHPTHCMNVFIPLIDVNASNGNTEFVPTTHIDDRFAALAPDVIKTAESNNFEVADGVVKPELPAGGFVMFDIRTMHRGGANTSPERRDVLYLTFAFDFWVDPFMFDSESLVKTDANRINEQLVNDLYKRAGGKPVESHLPQPYGHAHYTLDFHLLLLEDLNSQNDKTRGLSNCGAVAAFLALDSFERNACVNSFLRILTAEDAHKRRIEGLKSNRQKREKKIKAAKDVHGGADFASIQDDLSDVNYLYSLTNDLLATLMRELNFTQDGAGVGLTTMLSLFKFATPALAAKLEDCFTCWWNGSEGARMGRFLFHDAEAAEAAASPKDTLLVVFSSLGSGLCRPEWAGTLRQLGVFKNTNEASLDSSNKFDERVDVVHAMDPAYSWYNQDPECRWEGGDFFEKEIKKMVYAGSYKNVVFIGDSMGGAAALRLSHLANFTLAFTPQIDVEHYEAVKRLDFTVERRRDFKRKIIESVGGAKGYIEIHYGQDCLEDGRQVALLEGARIGSNRKCVQHKNVDVHTLSVELKKKGLLAGVVRAFLNRSLGQAQDLLQVGSKVGVYYDYYHVGEVTDVDEGEGKVYVKYKREGESYWETFPPVGGFERRNDIILITEAEYEEGKTIRKHPVDEPIVWDKVADKCKRVEGEISAMVTLGAGCYFGTEKFMKKDFEKIFPGAVKWGKVGFMGGKEAEGKTFSYEEVCGGKNGHIEVLQLELTDPGLHYEELIRFFYMFHDSTTRNRQGIDMGSQYASFIFTDGHAQEKIAQKVTAELGEFVKGGVVKCFEGREVCSGVGPAGTFVEATSDHQDYMEKNANHTCNHYMRFKEWPAK